MKFKEIIIKTKAD